MVVERFSPDQPSAVLLSGGLDSAVLLAHAAQAGPVQPLYVGVGLAWEDHERAAIARLLAALCVPGNIRPLVTLHADMRDVYPETHWAVCGVAPAFDTPDEDVYLDGRNVILLAKASVFMARQGLSRVFIGPLAGNPFPDATPRFFEAMACALRIGLASSFEIAAPFAGLHKADVIRLGASLAVPFELTLSCMQPIGGRHCGRCSKCRERMDGFVEAGMVDPADYAAAPLR